MTATPHFFNEDYSISVNGIGGPRTSLELEEKFNEHAYVVLDYACPELTLNIRTAGAQIEFTRINAAQFIDVLKLRFWAKDISFQFDEGTERLFRQLITLQLIGDLPSHFPSIKAMENLRSLEIVYDKQYLDWQEHDQLIDLKLAGYTATDLHAFAGMRSLRRLHLIDSTLSSLDGIEALPALETLWLNNVKKLTKPYALAGATKLKNFFFQSGSVIKNWQFLTAMPQLEYLGLQEVDSIDFLDALPRLVFFNAKKMAGKAFPSKTTQLIEARLAQRRMPEFDVDDLPIHASIVDLPEVKVSQSVLLNSVKAEGVFSNWGEDCKVFTKYDNSALVVGIGSVSPCFTCSSHLQENAGLISQFSCRRLHITAGIEENQMDLTLINAHTDIDELKLTINSAHTELLYDEETINLFNKLVVLEYLCTHSRQFPSIKAMENLQNLEIVYDRNNHDWLEHKNIVDLILFDYSEADLRPLAGMPSLRRLYLLDSKLSSLDGIDSIPQLETIRISRARSLVNLDALSKARTIKNMLFESWSLVKDWHFLSAMPQLERLHVQEVSDLDFLEALPKLVFFNCEKVAGKTYAMKSRQAINEKLAARQVAAGQSPDLDGPFYASLVKLKSAS